MALNRFPGVGIWQLVSSENLYEDGSVSYPNGKDAIGRLIYDAMGNMAVQVGNIHRPAFVNSDRLRGTAAEIQMAFEGYTAYFGTYSVAEKRGAVTHHVISSLFPNWAGTDQVRYYQFSGKRLVLKTDPMLADGKKVTGVITWERIG
jgi:hypothetical protein